jgi:hypothetical protein
MESIAYINLQDFNPDAQKELKTFIDFLKFKYKIDEEKNNDSRSESKRFSAISIDTRNFKFDRDEANER